MNRKCIRKLLSECIGTFALVFVGTGAIVINEASGGTVTHVGIAMSFGLVILAMIYTFGDISGAHFNPAVTIGFFLAKRFRAALVAPYLIAQCAGALFASILLHFLFPGNKLLGTTLPAGSDLQSFILEFVLTFILMLVILRVSKAGKERGITAGIVIGSVIGLEAMFAGPICGASMNPARSLAPALVSGHMDHLWLYIVGTILGAAASVPVNMILTEPESVLNA